MVSSRRLALDIHERQKTSLFLSMSCSPCCGDVPRPRGWTRQGGCPDPYVSLRGWGSRMGGARAHVRRRQRISAGAWTSCPILSPTADVSASWRSSMTSRGGRGPEAQVTLLPDEQGNRSH